MLAQVGCITQAWEWGETECLKRKPPDSRQRVLEGTQSAAGRPASAALHSAISLTISRLLKWPP